MKKLGVKRFFMVGDLVLDILAAKSAKGVAILVKREDDRPDTQDPFISLPEEVLRRVQTATETRGASLIDYVVQSLAEVPPIILAKLQRMRLND